VGGRGFLTGTLSPLEESPRSPGLLSSAAIKSSSPTTKRENFVREKVDESDMVW